MGLPMATYVGLPMGTYVEVLNSHSASVGLPWDFHGISVGLPGSHGPSWKSELQWDFRATPEFS